MKNRLMILLSLSIAINAHLYAQSKVNPTELGRVEWIRDLDRGQVLSQKENKPILLLFQEVPGCGTCQKYGQNVLSHPLIVETIERFFVPVAIFNNKGGKDAEVLKYFKEPSWNNPVVRVIDSKRVNITPRLAGDYSPSALVQTIMTAMTKSGQIIPNYLNILLQELSAVRTKTAFYSMYCFWSGESHFGRKDGVLYTEPGFANGHEVVQVIYDSELISKKDLDYYAKQAKCTAIDQPSGYQIDKEPKYYMSKTNFRFVPMTPLQQTKVNGALGANQDPSIYLSEKQKELLLFIENNEDHGFASLIDTSFLDGWNRVMK